MSKKNNLADSGLKKLCSFLVLASQQGELINDTLQAQDKVFSSKHVTDLINSMSEQDKKYVDDIVANLNKLSSKTTNVIPDSSNAEPNTLYLYSADPNPTSYNQYMVLSDKTILDLGTTNISLDGYLKETDADNKYLKQVDSHTHSNKLILDSMSQDKIDKWDNSVSENKVKEIIDSERPITTTINSTSTDTQIPSAKSVYTRTRGIIIVNSNINTYGTEILKYKVGRWIISSNSLAAQYSDLPVQSAGIMDIETISPSDEATPWDGAYSYRLYTFKTYDGGTYIRKIESSDVAGDIKDTGWQRVCATKVADVAETTINLSEISPEFTSGYIIFEVLNGICYMSIIDLVFANTPTGNLSVNIPGIPKRKFDGWHTITNVFLIKPSILNIGANGGSIEFYVGREANQPYYGTFSYPVAES